MFGATTLLPLLLCMAALVSADPISARSSFAYCKNPPPGVRKMARGVDITELDLCPLESGVSNGFKNPVVNLACYRGRPWARRANSYDTPDQVWTITTSPAGLLYSDSYLYLRSADLRKSMRTQVGGRQSLFKYAFSSSDSYRKMQTLILSEKSVFTDSAAVDSVNRIDLNPYWALPMDRFAKDYLDTYIGSKSYSDDPKAYQGFIDLFGTHYFSTANFGGSIRVLHRTSTSYLTQNSQEQVRRSAYRSFQNVLTNYYKDKSKSEVDRAFLSASSQYIKYYGGSANLLDYDGIQGWQPTVESDPWMLSGELRPISDLIQDEALRGEMQKAVWQYVLRRYLEELRRLFDIRRGDYGSDADNLDQALTDLEQKLTGQLSKDDVVALSQKLKADSY